MDTPCHDIRLANSSTPVDTIFRRVPRTNREKMPPPVLLSPHPPSWRDLAPVCDACRSLFVEVNGSPMRHSQLFGGGEQCEILKVKYSRFYAFSGERKKKKKKVF
ncbi:hypothetical protein HNY73_016501 [Argiope bruennichi]|uniref:Uncharacterized protein n=1 Tax=Argiope bruennichi TaxID=94029 RepID=A0A8T0EIZ5_ARGBR|nr:hypothetical protein HNY73_016501 [Argiope bruennichi]